MVEERRNHGRANGSQVKPKRGKEEPEGMDIMRAYQERVVEEQDRLEKRIFKLRGFLAKSSLLTVAEAGLLCRQLDAMEKYSSILLERIEPWSKR